MRAVCFIGKFQLLLDCNKYENHTSKSRTAQTCKTLGASGFEHSNSQDNSDEKLMVSLVILTYKMTTNFSG